MYAEVAFRHLLPIFVSWISFCGGAITISTYLILYQIIRKQNTAVFVANEHSFGQGGKSFPLHLSCVPPSTHILPEH